MELVRYITNQTIGIGLRLSDNKLRNITDMFPTFSEAVRALGNDPDYLERLATDKPIVSEDNIQLLAPVGPEANIHCVALNYAAHAEEAGLGTTELPIVFNKLHSAMVGHEAAIEIPPISNQLDYEAELAVIIGRDGYRISEQDAMEYVAGYTIINDTTARDLQWTKLGPRESVDWFSSKCLQRSTPLGPAIIPARQIADPHNLHIRSWVNGELRQDAPTSLMLRKIPALIAFISSRIELQAGDVIATGTPKGVGGFANRFLQDGDIVRVEIPGVGVLQNPVRKISA